MEVDRQLKDEQAQTNLAETAPPPPEKTAAAYLLFVPFLIVFLAILFFFDVTQRIALLFGLRWQERAARWLNYFVFRSLHVLGTSFRFEGTPDIEMGTPHLIISNHQSMFDLPVLYTLFYRLRPRYVAKLELAKWVPSISICLRSDGSALIDRSNPRQAIPEIRALGERMNQGRFATILFPEGTRARDGKLKAFRAAGFGALLDSVPEARIIPVAVDGSWKLMYFKRGPIPTGVRFKVKVGRPLSREGKKSSQLIEEAHTEIRSMLHELRKETGPDSSEAASRS